MKRIQGPNPRHTALQADAAILAGLGRSVLKFRDADSKEMRFSKLSSAVYLQSIWQSNTFCKKGDSSFLILFFLFQWLHSSAQPA